MELDQIIEIIKTSIKDAYNEGFDDGSTKQAILEIQGRDRFLEELRASRSAVETEAKYRCFFCGTPTQATEKGQTCPECGGRPA